MQEDFIRGCFEGVAFTVKGYIHTIDFILSDESELLSRYLDNLNSEYGLSVDFIEMMGAFERLQFVADDCRSMDDLIDQAEYCCELIEGLEGSVLKALRENPLGAKRQWILAEMVFNLAYTQSLMKKVIRLWKEEVQLEEITERFDALL